MELPITEVVGIGSVAAFSMWQLHRITVHLTDAYRQEMHQERLAHLEMHRRSLEQSEAMRQSIAAICRYNPDQERA